MEIPLALRMIDTWALTSGRPVRVDYRDFNLAPHATVELDGVDTLHIIEYADEGVRVESDNGYYDLRNALLNENTHQHEGAISLINTTNQTQNITFVVGVGA